MRLARLERRLADVQRQLDAAREGLNVLEEQLAVWREMLDETRLRSMVSETPQATKEFTEMARQVDNVTAAIDRQRGELADLVVARDALFSKWQVEEAL